MKKIIFLLFICFSIDGNSYVFDADCMESIKFLKEELSFERGFGDDLLLEEVELGEKGITAFNKGETGPDLEAFAEFAEIPLAKILNLRNAHPTKEVPLSCQELNFRMGFGGFASPDEMGIKPIVNGLKSLITFNEILKDLDNGKIHEKLKEEREWSMKGVTDQEILKYYQKLKNISRKKEKLRGGYGGHTWFFLYSIENLKKTDLLIAEIRSGIKGPILNKVFKNDKAIVISDSDLFKHGEAYIKALEKYPDMEVEKKADVALLDYINVLPPPKVRSDVNLLTDKETFFNELKIFLSGPNTRGGVKYFLQMYGKKFFSFADKACAKASDISKNLKIPILDQRSSAMCGVFAAATFIDIWRRLHLPNYTKDYANPYWMGYLAKMNESGRANKTPQSFEYASGELAIDTIFRGMDGICKNEVIDNTLKRYLLTDQTLNIEEFYYFLRWIFKIHDSSFEAQMNRFKRRKDVNEEIKNEVFMPRWKKSKNNTGKKYVKPALDSLDLRKIYFTLRSYLRKKNLLGFWNSFFYRCQIRGAKFDELLPDNIKNYGLCVKRIGVEGTNEVLNRLSKNNPVGVIHEIGVLQSMGGTSLHQVIIMGNRMNKGKCELLVQNSWGETLCVPKRFSRKTGRARDVSCQFDDENIAKGLWVPLHQLLSRSRSVYFIYEKDKETCESDQ